MNKLAFSQTELIFWSVSGRSSAPASLLLSGLGGRRNYLYTTRDYDRGHGIQRAAASRFLKCPTESLHRTLTCCLAFDVAFPP